MRRSILTSFVLIGAVLALVVGAGTFATFSNEQTISSQTNDVGATTLVMVLEDEGDTSLSFKPGTAEGCDSMADGDTCVTTFDISHGADNILEFKYAGNVTEDGDSTDCFVATISDASNSGGVGVPTFSNSATNNGEQATFERPDTGTDGSDTSDALDVGEIDSIELTVTLTPGAGVDPNDCQGVTGVTYTVDVTATQSNSPHD